MSIMSPSTNETSTIVSVWSCLAMPAPILPPNPSFVWQLLPGPGNMPMGVFLSFYFFFFLFLLHSTYGTFLLIASGACGATVQALLRHPARSCCASCCTLSHLLESSNIAMGDVEQRSAFGSLRPYRKQKANYCELCCSKKEINTKLS